MLIDILFAAKKDSHIKAFEVFLFLRNHKPEEGLTTGL